MTSISDILNGGFNLLLRRPGAVLVWALVRAALSLFSLVVIMPRMLAQMQATMEIMAKMEPGSSSQASQMAMMQSMNGSGGLGWLMWLVGMFVSAVLLCAAFRAVLRPSQGGIGFLRVGGDELRMLGMLLVLTIGSGIAAGIFVLLVFLVGMVMTLIMGNSPALVGLMWFVLVFGAIAAMIYVAVRLSMMLPLTFIRRQLVIDEAWTRTRGRFWTLFIPYLVFFVLLAVVGILVSIPFFWPLFSELAHMPHNGDRAAAEAFMAGVVQHWLANPLATLGPLVLLGSVLGAISLALNGGAMATAARGFLRDDGKLPEDMLAESEFE
jgi:hypothetical protein